MYPVLEQLRRRPLLADGAMGTMLLGRGVRLDQCLETLNVTQPDWIRSIQLAYANAGADILLTHTFGAHELRLETHGLAEQTEAINRAAVRIARDVRETTGRNLFLAGDIGPLGPYLAPHGPLAPERARAVFARQAAALLEGGIDLFCLETLSDLNEVEQAVRAIRQLTDLPILVSLTFGRDALTQFGVNARAAARFLRALPVDVIGANCSVGPASLQAVVAAYRAADAETALAVMPNAGFPTRVDGRLTYAAGPEYFAEMASAFLNLGVAIIGGCCGTTPAHIQALRQALDAWLAAGRDMPRTDAEAAAVQEPLPHPFYVLGMDAGARAAYPASRLRQKLDRGDFVVSVEVDPPRGLQPDKQIAGARLAQARGADAINVADSPMARVRMGALAMAALIQQAAGIETILHFTTRDRSLMGLQADLLGAHALGVRNVLALTGDPPSLGDSPNSSPVYDVDSVGLVRILNQFNRGLDLEGKAMGQRSNYCISVACDPTRQDLAREADRLQAKLAHGAHYVMTQPIYDPAVWTRFTRVYEAAHGALPVPVLIGILPLQSFRHASFLHHEVPGITLSADALQRMREAGQRGRQEGVAMAQQLLLALMDAPYVQGVYLMPSFGRYETACQVLDVVPASVRARVAA